MVSDEQMREDLIEIYSRYLTDNRDKENNKRAYEIYTKYFNGADTLFSEEISTAIWGSFDLSEGKLSKEKVQKILKDLEKS